jgi:DNA (cytosine-5)-methyltransferase 1
MRWPTAIDLFCGCGGMTLGLKLARFRVLGAVDIDPLSTESYLLNHPTVPVWTTDIRDLGCSEVMDALCLEPGELDLLAGCPPCQGFSSLRTLNGSRRVRDRRNDLVLDFFRFVAGLLPKTVMMENVPGLKGDRRFSRLCRDLKNLGYETDDAVLDAASFGVPQRRRRLILIGGRYGPVGLASANGVSATVKEAIGALPAAGRSQDPLHDVSENRSAEVQALIKKIPHNGGSRTDLPASSQLQCHIRCDGFKDVYGRIAWDDVAPTITSGFVNPSKGRFLHPEADRTITLREAALLQSFPRKYRISLRRGKYPAAALIGNALPPDFVKPHAKHIAAYLRAARRASDG